MHDSGDQVRGKKILNRIQENIKQYKKIINRIQENIKQNERKY